MGGKIQGAASAKREAARRAQGAKARDAQRSRYVAAVHSEIASVNEEVKQAQAQLTDHRVAGARTIRAAHHAIEGHKAHQQQQAAAQARAARDRVQASKMRTVPPEIAAQIERTMRYGRGVSTPPHLM